MTHTREAQNLAVHCEQLEQRITETAAAIGELNAKVKVARTADDHQNLQAQIDFAASRRRSLIDERIEAERSLRQQRLADLDASQPANPMADLLAERKKLEDRLQEIAHLIRVHESSESRFSRSFDVGAQQLERFDLEIAPRLRKRLESLGE
jgi:hypothetical protein